MGVIQGDCLAVLPTLPDASVEMVFADLPYGVTHNYWDSLINLPQLWGELLRVGTEAAVYVFTATQPFATAVISSQPRLFRYDLIWQKTMPVGYANANVRPMSAHETVLIFSRATANPASKLRMTYNPQKTEGKPYKALRAAGVNNYGSGLERILATDNRTGDRHPTTVVTVAAEAKREHPTQKPVALLEWLIRTYTNPGETVLDPTAGSGTTAVAAVRARRRYIAIERDPFYAAMVRRRVSATQPPLLAPAVGVA